MTAEKNKKDNLPVFLFHQGTNYNSYEYLGAHLTEVKRKKGVVFRVWAGTAEAVFVVGDFNGWDTSAHPMKKVSEGGVFELFIEGLKEYDTYKYCVKSGEKEVLKSDPYAFHGENGGTASKIYDIEGYNWSDGEYIRERTEKNVYSSAMNIYEAHLGSWKKYEDGNPFDYKKLAEELVPYVKSLNYTHIEVMPINEYPFDGSWGYQVTGYFAVTSRFGTPKDFMYFVDCCHKEGIGVIIDWVPAHFPKDLHGLYEFDGKPLYENAGWDRKEHKTWGTRRFDYGRSEVQSFLASSAVMLFDKYHIDGIRVDAVASMLYLDYDKKPGEWLPNQYGENKNLEAIAFLRKLNTAVFERYPYALMIAEESTAWPGITLPVHEGGLGFNFKWNMGWMNDALSYMQTDPYFRAGSHNKLTFSMTYAFSENYILPVSHDEVVHGKRSLLDKMPGTYEDKFANMRAFLCYMYTHPGKKLIFMGCEFGQFKEWAFKEGLEFFMTDFAMHKKLFDMVGDLNAIYKNTPALYSNDYSWKGFEWLSVDEKDKNLIAYNRYGDSGSALTVILNFSGSSHEGYTLGIDKGKYRIIFNTDDKKYGGAGALKTKTVTAKKTKSHGKDWSIKLNIPRLSCMFLIRENN